MVQENAKFIKNSKKFQEIIFFLFKTTINLAFVEKW